MEQISNGGLVRIISQGLFKEPVFSQFPAHWDMARTFLLVLQKSLLKSFLCTESLFLVGLVIPRVLVQ